MPGGQYKGQSSEGLGLCQPPPGCWAAVSCTQPGFSASLGLGDPGSRQEGWVWLWVTFPGPRLTRLRPGVGTWDTAPLQQLGFYLLGNDAFLI